MSVPENVASISGIVLFNGNMEAARIVANEISSRVKNIRDEDSTSVVTETEEDASSNSSVLKFCVVDVSDSPCLSVVRDLFKSKFLLKKAFPKGGGSCVGSVVVAHTSMIGIGIQGPRVEVFQVDCNGDLWSQLQVTEDGGIDFYRNPDAIL
jgi:hypothetical protein